MASLPTRGIDISEFNGDVNIDALKGQIDFVIIRCGYGSNYANQDDTQYENNVRKCLAAGIPYGVYLYSYAKNTDMAKSEAAHTLRLLQGKTPLYGVWYDVEDSSLPSGETIIDNCITYCREIEKAGYYCGIYSFLNWMETRLNSPRLDPFDKWVAQWNDVLEYDKPYGMWQYTNNGILNGRQFDMDYAYKDYPEIIKGMGGDDMTKEEVLKLAQQVYDENEKRYPTIDSVPNWAREGVKQVYEELNLGGNGTDPGKIELDASYSYVRAVYVISKVLERFDTLLRQADAEISAFSQEMPVDSDAEKKEEVEGQEEGRAE